MKEGNLARRIGLVLGPVLFVVLLNVDLSGISPNANKVLAVAVWMITWWITETVSIPVTALLPLFLFPILDVIDFPTVATNYASPIVFLFFGGFVLALAMEKVNLHKRIALNIIKLTGTNANGVILGFMLSTAFLSMWISNTATTLVILPIALTMIQFLTGDGRVGEKEQRNFALATLLGIAFAANIGGTATVIGTPPNVVLIGFLESEHGQQMDFARWSSVGFPFATVMLTCTYFILIKFFPNGLGNLGVTKDVLSQEISKLGKISRKERLVLFCFGLTAFLWIFRTTVNNLLDLSLSNAQIGILGALLTFIVPSNFMKSDFVLKWEDTQKLQWGILILFGGGLALAKGMSEVGIIDFIGNFVRAKGYSQTAAVPFLISTMLFMTELMSNVALVAVFSPMISGIADGIQMEFLHLAIPITLASSCAFMLPMATPPNAIVFVSGYIRVMDMVRIGVVLNILAILLLVVMSFTLIPLVF